VTFDFDTLRVLLPVAIFLVLAMLETARAAVPLAGDLGTRWTSNVALYAINTGLALGMGWLGLSTVAPSIQAHSLGIFPALFGTTPVWLQFIAAALIIDLYLYAQHRVLHIIPAFWRLHGVHHADVDLDVTTGFRHHPGEHILSSLAGIAVSLALGIPPLLWSIYAMLATSVVLIQHANLRLPEALDRALRLVLVTPGMHRHHHATDRAIHDTNYGTLLSVWDRLFRTYHTSAPEQRDIQLTGLPGLRSLHDQRLGGVLAMPARLGPGA